MDEFIRRCCATVRDTLHRLLMTPAPATQQAQGCDDRASLFKQLNEIRSARHQAIAQHAFEVGHLVQQLDELQARASILRTRLAEMQYQQFCDSLNFSAEENRILAGLAEKRSTSLQLFLEEIDGELADLNRKEPFSIPEVKRDYLALKKTRIVHTDGPSIQRRTRALSAARQRAQEMIYEPMTVEQLNAEILRLQRSLPPIVSEEISGERASMLHG
jgi:hypothetical protein